MAKTATATKSAANTAAAPAPARAVPGRPFKRGEYDPTRQGRGPKKGAPNAGRPKDRIVEMAAAGLEKALPLLIDTALGEAVEKMVTPEGIATNIKVSPTANERSKAVEVLAKVARKIGAKIDVEHSIGRPTLNIVEQIVRKL